ncbi:T9SS type A sorting domain-containing protein, partial [Ulvibacter litoralis]
TVAVSWQQFWSSGAIGTNVTSTPAFLGRLKMRYINTGETPDFCFNVAGSLFDDQFYTACGPFTPGPAGADCAGFPGTQLFDYDGSDCSGALLPVACAVKTWDGSNWNPAGNPTATDHVVISDDYDTATDGGSITACEVTVDASTTLTISADDFLSVANNITVDGTLNVAHTANVVQIDDAATVTNNGTINVYVDTPALDGRDFMLMGSPMTTETRAGVFDGAMRIRNHLTENFSPNTEVMEASNGAGVWVDEEGDDWLVYEAGINPGEGYMVMRDIVGPATALNLNFTQGTLNNGVITYAAEYNGTQNASPNIIANPYASAISATDFINANDNVDAVYFWEHITAPNSGTPGPYGLDYTMEDISIFNLTGGTSAAGSDAGTLPNGIISTGQGFGVKASNAEPITFNNSMRLTSGNTTLRKRDIDRIWLNVQSNGYELNSTALIGFIQEATDGIDIGYDAKRLATNVALYSHLDDGSNQLGIQSRGVFSENMKIPMGFATLIDEQINYTISIENIEGLNLESATVYLIDNQEETITNLSNEDYTFGSEKGIFDNRFTIQFVPEVILGTDASVLENIAIYPNPTQSILSIVSPKFMVTNVTVYDIIGRVVMSQNFENSKKVAIDLSELNSAIYFAEINTEAGKMTKRIIKE